MESYCLNMKSNVEDEKFNDKLYNAGKTIILDKCNEVMKWLDANKLGYKEELEHKPKEIERVWKPIVTKLYQPIRELKIPPGFQVVPELPLVPQALYEDRAQLSKKSIKCPVFIKNS